MIDTPPGRRGTRLLAVLATWLIALPGLSSCASTRPGTREPAVIWARDERVVLARADSSALVPGTHLTFFDRDKIVAAGEVTGAFDRDLVVARLTSGSLAGVKDPARLRVRGEWPRPRALPLLRIGYASPGRASLLFACGGMTLDPASSTCGYRTDAVTEHSYRLVRGPESLTPVPWPDTLLIREFDEAADEEIALERGELDAAVFWPGELSAHMREDPRWQPALLGVRARGVLAAIELAPPSPRDSGATTSDSLAFASLNRELFRGDLVPLTRTNSSDGLRRPASTRFVVDPSCPGQRLLERFLNRGANPPSARGPARTLHLVYLDAPMAAPDSLGARVTAYMRRGDFTAGQQTRADSASVRCLFAMGCPLVCSPDLRPRLSSLGADALVNLLACPPPERSP